MKVLASIVAIVIATFVLVAVAYAGFVGCEGRNVDDRRAMEMAANIVSSRLLKQVRPTLLPGLHRVSHPPLIVQKYRASHPDYP